MDTGNGSSRVTLDFLDEIVAESTAQDPSFPRLLEAARERRALMKALAERRRTLRLSQTQVAASMGTSQSVVARLESGEVDARLSTVDRFAEAVAAKVEWRLREG